MSDAETGEYTMGSPSGSVDIPVAHLRYDRPASETLLQTTVRSLEANGFQTVVVPDAAAARHAVLELVPPGSEVLDAPSETLREIGVAPRLQEGTEFRSLRPRLAQLSQDGKFVEQRKLGSAPDYVVGSVHAITARGEVVIASASGSQLGPYAFGAGRVIWVVGTQKIVEDLEEAYRRIEEYTLPLEDARALKAYGMHSMIGKLLVVRREAQPGRITVILVKERLGF